MSTSLPLSGQVAIVTGASSGIGAATASALADAGASVVLAARRRDRIQALADGIVGRGGTALAVPTDVADEAQASAMVQRAQEEYGRVDILVNNAGVMHLGPVADADTDDWRAMIDVNLYGALYGTRAIMPILNGQGTGDIINVGSLGGYRTSAGRSLYALTKFGLRGFTEALRAEALEHGVRVTFVAPGMVETEMSGGSPHAFQREAAARARAAIGQPLAASDVADVILYAVTRPRHVSLNEILMRPTRQVN